MYYLQSQYYNPAIGRFINADTFAASDIDGFLSFNMFAYCEHNPVNLSDPSGELPAIIIGAAVGFAWGALSSVVSSYLTGQTVSATSVLASGISGAISGALETTGIGGGWKIAINGAISAIDSIVSDISEGGHSFGGILLNASVSAGMGALSSNIGLGLDGKEYNSACKIVRSTKNALKAGGLHPNVKRAYKSVVSTGINYLKKARNAFALETGGVSMITGVFKEIYKRHTERM